MYDIMPHDKEKEKKEKKWMLKRCVIPIIQFRKVF